MAKAKNLLLAGLLALVSLFSIGLFAACGNEAENKGGNEPAEVQAVAIGDVTVISNDKQAKLSTFTNEIEVFNDQNDRDFVVTILVNGEEVAKVSSEFGGDVKDALNATELVIKSGDEVKYEINYCRYVCKKGDFLGLFDKWSWGTGDLSRNDSQTFVVA